MLDYRANSNQSPIVWCTTCNGLCPATHAKVMKTAFKLHGTGIYPFGLCEKRCKSNATAHVTDYTIKIPALI